MAHPKAEQRRGFFFYAHFQKYTTNLFQIKEENLRLLSIRQSRFFRRSLLRLARVSQCGALLTSWKATETTILRLMLMYGKEASNRKQEIDRQHYTIPNQRPKDKHCGKI
nr:hypothetical protein [Ruminococcus bromii]